MFVNEIFGLKKYDKDERGSRSQLLSPWGEKGNEEGGEETDDDEIILVKYINGVMLRILRVCIAAFVISVSRKICLYVYDKTNDEGTALLCAFMFIGVVIYVLLPRLKEKKGDRRYR